MAQQDLLMPWLSIMDNIFLGHKLTKKTVTPAQHQTALDLLDRVGLSGCEAHYPNTLSGGMRQRAALVRTLMQDKPFVFMDEPFSALDAVTRHHMQALAFELLKDRTVLLITHDPQEALRLGQQILILKQNEGLKQFPVPSSIPLRAADDPHIFLHQKQLMEAL